jgi:hypothetical protein
LSTGEVIGHFPPNGSVGIVREVAFVDDIMLFLEVPTVQPNVVLVPHWQDAIESYP